MNPQYCKVGAVKPNLNKIMDTKELEDNTLRLESEKPDSLNDTKE